MSRVNLHTGPGVFEVLAHVCRSPQEAMKQFVENAADAVEESNIDEGQIQIKLKYKPGTNGSTGQQVLKSISVQDNGIGMTPQKMRQVLHQIGSSEKLNSALRGEQGIGLLAFALIADELHLASTAKDGKSSSCLVLKRSWLKRGHAEIIKNCKAHTHTERGTVAHLEGILPEIEPLLTKEHIKEYMGQQFASDLRSNMYAMSISDDHVMEPIHPQHFRGVKALAVHLPVERAGNAYVELYVLPWDMQDASISLYGRGGTRVCALSDLPDFKILPWTDKRLEGYIRYDRLKRTADKTALVQDQVFQSFVQTLKQTEPKIQQLIADVSAESQERRFTLLLGRASKLIDRFVRYRNRGTLETFAITQTPEVKSAKEQKPAAPVTGVKKEAGSRAPTHAPYIKISKPSENNAVYRSWYDPKQEVICINREHAEFLLSQREDRRCLRYLFYVWAKETILREYGEQAQKVADEMVGVLAEAEPLLR